MLSHPASRIFAVLAAMTAIAGGVVFVKLGTEPAASIEAATIEAPAVMVEEPTVVLPIHPLAETTQATSPFASPMTQARNRVTKKPFGIEIHPKTSPVPNDRFSGFHVGVDFETTPEEVDTDVPVFAICEGPLLISSWARGYGGVVIQGCVIDGTEVSVIYGHINTDSVTSRVGDILNAGDQIALLGRGGSQETDGVRKHLHLGIRKGREKDMRGYVPTHEEEGLYLNALDIIPE